MYNELNLDTLTVVFRQDARLIVDGDALVGVVSALQGDGRDGGRVAGDDLHLGNIALLVCDDDDDNVCPSPIFMLASLLRFPLDTVTVNT